MQIRKMSLMLAAAMLLSPFSLALAEQPPVEPDAPSEAVSEPVEEAVSEP